MRENMEGLIKNIYKHMADEDSKKIFGLKYMYYLTKDNYFLREVAKSVPECGEVYKLLKESIRKKYIFGAGMWGRSILRIFDDIEFEGFIDNNKMLYGSEGERIISMEEYLSESEGDEIIVISSRVYNKQILNQLIENGIKKENIINAGEINDNLNKRQYFDLPQLRDNISEKENFVDGGCLDGRSSVYFKKWAGVRCGRIFAFEPDSHNEDLCRKEFLANGIFDYEIISKGLWNEEAVLEFEENENGLSKLVEENGNTKVPVNSLDNMINEKVTFIKMDIEGAEYKALLGCKRTIIEEKPKLAISIYHKPEDIIQIPELILCFNDKYSFYIRHYSMTGNETILYAL